MTPRGCLALLVACGAPQAPPILPDPVPAATPVDAAATATWTVRFPFRNAQQVDVELTVPARPGAVTLYLPAWNPGSYVIRDYARNVKAVQAATPDGQPLPVDHPAFDRWTVLDASQGLTVRYQLHCADWSVRGCWAESDLAVLNGAAVFLAPLDVPPETPGIYDIRLELPDAWPDVATGLPPHPGGERHRFRAASYQELIDSPILAGPLRITRRTVGEIPVTLALAGHGEAWDLEARADEVARIMAANATFWNGAPFRDYHVLQLVGEGRGGLEHANSTLILSGRHAHRLRADHLAWLGLVSHEVFHAWNIKRMRPENLGPFDLTVAAPTPELWVAEGLTSYYDDLLLTRAGLLSEKEQLDALSKQIRAVQDTPGRRVRSVRDAGTDAWIKHYQPDPDLENAAVSYYTKGAVVGFVLDAAIRRNTEGAASLDDVMRRLYAAYSGPTGYRGDQVHAEIVAVGGEALGPMVDAWINGTDEIDYTPALSLYGLRWSSTAPAPGADPAGGWLGVTADAGPSARVRSVRRDGPAWNADVLPGDEVIAVEGYRVDGPLDVAIARFDPGVTVTLTLARRGKLRDARVVLADPPESQRWTLEIDPEAAPEMVANRRRWLYGPAEAPPPDPKTAKTGPPGPVPSGAPAGSAPE